MALKLFTVIGTNKLQSSSLYKSTVKENIASFSQLMPTINTPGKKLSGDNVAIYMECVVQVLRFYMHISK